MPDKITWVFFDLGSTLIDETAADAHRIRDMIAGTGVTEQAYREKRMEMIRRGLGGDQGAIAFFGLTKTPWHSEDETPYEDAAPTLAELKTAMETFTVCVRIVSARKILAERAGK